MAKNIAIVATMFHKEHLAVMVEEARNIAKEAGLNIAKEVWVPGSYEIPLALKRILAVKDIDGAVVLGVIERGETKHGMVMGIMVHEAIVRLELETGKPVGLAILGPEILPEQIAQRRRPYARKAVEALKSMLELKI